MDNVLVTCLCLTRNRRQWLPKAIECFLSQTFESKELLIVHDGESVDDLIPNDEPSISVFQPQAVYTIGRKRNEGIKQARGNIIAHWDDDDYSAPGRLEDQVTRLLASGLSVTGYHTMKFTDGERNWLCSRRSHYAIGTSLCYKKQWALEHPFLDKQIGEDNSFGSFAQTNKQLICAPCEDFMSAAIHAGNTSKKRTEAMKAIQ